MTSADSSSVPAPLSPTERILIGAFLLFATVFSVIPVYNTIHRIHKGDEGTKDYPIWYNTGHRELHGISPYYLDKANEFPFMYPPGAAGLLAPLSIIGHIPMVMVLVIINSIAWATCILAPIYLVSGRIRGAPLSLYWAPSLICCIFIWDTYLEGQLAFCLSACLLAMLVFLKQKREWSAGAMLALAAGFKAFPILALPYLIYRRHWTALASTFIVLFILLFALPACFRGPAGAWDDLKTWQQGMLEASTATKMSPHGRGERSYTWQNGSILGLAHRWLRHTPGDTDDSNGRPLPVVYINIANLSLDGVKHVADGILVLLGISYVAVTSLRRPRTQFATAAEGAMLLILVVLACPLSFTYNNAWLMCGIAVVLYFVGKEPGWTSRAKLAAIWLTLALLPQILSISTNLYAWRYMRAMGNTLLSDMLLLTELGWLILTANVAEDVPI